MSYALISFSTLLIAVLFMTHWLSCAWRLTLASASAGATPLDVSLAPPHAELPAVAYWAVPPADAPLGLERSRLMLPLNEIVDEHYSVYWCRLAPDQPPPEYCLP